MPPKKWRTYTEIAALYRRQIQDGVLSPGDRLPTMREIQEQTGAAMNTISRALQMLKDEGLTTSTSTGTVVAEQPDIVITGVARLNRIQRTGKPHARDETTTGHWTGVRSCADPVTADLLGIEPHEEIVIRRRVFLRNGTPTSIGLSFIHMRAIIDVPELVDGRPIEGWWQDLYRERTGRDVTRSPERRTARLVSNDELNALGIDLPAEVAAAVLVVVNVFHDERGPLEVWEDVYPPGTWQVDDE